MVYWSMDDFCYVYFDPMSASIVGIRFEPDEALRTYPVFRIPRAEYDKMIEGSAPPAVGYVYHHDGVIKGVSLAPDAELSTDYPCVEVSHETALNFLEGRWAASDHRVDTSVQPPILKEVK